MKLLDRHLLLRLPLPFAIGGSLLAVIYFADHARGLGEMMFSANVPAGVVAKYLALRLPTVTVLALPAGLLLATAVVTNRLTRDGELAAMQAAQVSLWRLSAPLIAAGAVGSLLAYGINEWVAPVANRRGLEVLSQMALGQPLARPASNVPIRGPGGEFFFLGHLDPVTNTIQQVMIQEPGRGLTPRQIIVAERAEYEGRRWTLYQGAVYRLDDRGRLLRVETFYRRPYELQAPLQSYLVDQRPDEQMTSFELRQRIAVLSAGGRETQKLRTGLHFKFSLPLSCVIVVLIALPISYQTSRFGGAAGPAVGIILGWLYWNSLWWAKKLAFGGALDPALAAWLPVLVFGGLGVWLMHRAEGG